MKLSTNKLLTSSRNGSKMKKNSIPNPKKVTGQDIINREKLISPYENPFTKPKCKLNKNNQSKKKLKINRRNTNRIIPRIKIDIFPKNENVLKNSFLYNNLYSTEINSNKSGNKNIEDNNLEKENDIDKLHQVFKESNLKKTINIDRKGNNNLNIPKNYFIQDYKNKKKRKNINENKKYKIPVNYKENKKYVSTTFSNINRTKTLSKYKTDNNLINLKENINVKKIKNLLNNKISCKVAIPKNNVNINYEKNKKILSTQQIIHINDFKNFFEKNEKEKEENDISEKNSIFETYTNKSFNSSFLDSSLNDFFL